MTSFAEQMKHDPALRAFVDAQCGQIAVELAALKVEYLHQIDVMASQQRQIDDLQQQLRARKGRTGER